MPDGCPLAPPPSAAARSRSPPSALGLSPCGDVDVVHANVAEAKTISRDFRAERSAAFVSTAFRARLALGGAAALTALLLP